MDPNANLAEQRRIAKRFLDGGDQTTAEWMGDAERLAELVEELDQWITRGGFLPEVWSRAEPERWVK